MSGHSKWSTIKRKKGANDAKRGKLFTKLIKEITVAARLGGGDEESNPRLRQAVLAAKGANMPADNIKRAIQKGTGELPGISYEEALFEGYGPGGIAVMVDVTTANRKRTVAELRHLIGKYGGNLGESGCVAWMFEKKGMIIVEKDGPDEEVLLELIVKGGGDDFNDEGDVYTVYSAPENMPSVINSVEGGGGTIRSSEVLQLPANLVAIEGETARKVLQLMEALDDHDDVQRVSANFEIDDEKLETVD